MLPLFHIMTRQGPFYNIQLTAGLGLINETHCLLDLWEPGMGPTALYEAALTSGQFPNITARRLLNIVKECFSPRYLIHDGAPAVHLKKLKNRLSTTEINLFFLFLPVGQTRFFMTLSE